MKHSHTAYHRVIAALWCSLLVGLYVVFLLTEITARELLAVLFELFTTSWWGVGLFLFLYIARPLTLIPMSIFSVLSGVFFGLWLGAVVVYIGIAISATVSYLTGRWLRQAVLTLPVPVNRAMLHRHPFEVVTGLHLTMLPFDLINYGAGLLHVPWRPFVGGVLIGMIPGTISLTALGTAVNLPVILEGDITWHLFNWWYVGLSALIFIITLIGSYFWRQKTTHGVAVSTPKD